MQVEGQDGVCIERRRGARERGPTGVGCGPARVRGGKDIVVKRLVGPEAVMQIDQIEKARFEVE